MAPTAPGHERQHMNSNILTIFANVEVSDLEAAIPLYQELANGADVRRFTYHELEVGAVGPFLLLCGPTHN
jgi:hypothetical protein